MYAGIYNLHTSKEKRSFLLVEGTRFKVFFLNMFYFKDAMKLPSLASVAALTFVPDHVYEKITRTWTEINIEITGFCFITNELFLSIFYSSFLVTSALCLQTSDSSIFVV